MTPTDKIYQLLPASGSSPLVLDSPHSGSDYPTDFGYTCAFEDLKKCEDHLIDQLFESAARKSGAAFLKALFPRTYIDPNRSETDISDSMLPADWPHQTDPSSRSRAGHGLIRETIGNGISVYDRALSTEEIKHRLENYYRPYHRALETILEETLQTHGNYFHINCHCSPPHALEPFFTGPLPDIILGDRDGTSCDLSFRRDIQSFLIGLGYRVSVNLPYKGVEILRRHGNPAQGKNSLQIEINKDLYLTKGNEVISIKFNKLKENIEKLIHFISTRAKGAPVPIAAD